MPKDKKAREESRRQSTIAALLRERRGYQIHGDDANAAAVDAELKRLGAAAKPPAKRATKLDKKKPDASL